MIDFAGLVEELHPGRLVREGLRGWFGLPGQVHLSITERCNCRCLHCDLWSKARPGELDIDRWKGIVEELLSWLGPFTLKIAGGEPLVKEGVLDLVSHARRLGCETGMSTNGLAIDGAMAQRIVDSGLGEIHISLESSHPEHHDRIRNQPGAFGRTVAAIGHLNRRRTGLRIHLATVVVEQNLDDLAGVVSFARDNGLRTVHFQPLYQNFGQPHAPDWWRLNPFFPRSLDSLDRALDALVRIQRAEWLVGNAPEQLERMKLYFRDPATPARGRCMAGWRDVSFDPYGNVLACYWRDAIGNAREGSVRAIHEGPEGRRRRAEVRSCRRNCHLLNCNAEHGLLEKIRQLAPRTVAREA